MPSIRTRTIFLLMVFVVPYLVIYISGLPHWVGRLMADLIFVLTLTLGIFLYSLSSKMRMILEGGKLSRPEYARVRPKIERAIRIAGVAFGLFFTFYVTAPFVGDFGSVLASKAPLKISSQVRAGSGLMVFFRQSVYPVDPGVRSNTPYRLLYSLNPIQSGRRYELSVLPKSRMVVDYVELKN